MLNKLRSRLQPFLRAFIRTLFGRCPRCAGPRRRVGKQNRLVCLGLGCDFLPTILKPEPGAVMPDVYAPTTHAERQALLQQAAATELRNFSVRRHY